MNLPFLRHLPGLGRQLPARVIPESAAAAAKATLQRLLTELPELLLAAVIEVESGQAVASYTSQPQLRLTAAAPFWAASVRQLQASQVAQQQAEEQPEEILITMLSQLHLLRLPPTGHYCLYLAVDAQDTSLALAREVLRQSTKLMIIS